MASYGGDMSSRMHICRDTGRPVAPFIGANSIIKNYHKKFNNIETSYGHEISLDDINYLAYGLLIQKRLEYATKDKIYFDEDHFSEDLVNYFETILGEKQEEKKISLPQRIFNMFKDEL